MLPVRGDPGTRSFQCCSFLSKSCQMGIIIHHKTLELWAVVWLSPSDTAGKWWRMQGYGLPSHATQVHKIKIRSMGICLPWLPCSLGFTAKDALVISFTVDLEVSMSIMNGKQWISDRKMYPGQRATNYRYTRPPPIWPAQPNLVIKPPKQARADPSSAEGLVYFMNYYPLIYLPLSLIELCYLKKAIDLVQGNWSRTREGGRGWSTGRNAVSPPKGERRSPQHLFRPRHTLDGAKMRASVRMTRYLESWGAAKPFAHLHHRDSMTTENGKISTTVSASEP